MRRFVFIWFLISMLLIAALSAVGVLWSGPSVLLAAWGRYGSGLIHYGAETAAIAFDTGGMPALEAFEKRIDPSGAVRFFIFDSSPDQGRGANAPPVVRGFAARLSPDTVRFLPLGRVLLAGCVIGPPDRARRVVIWLPARINAVPPRLGGWMVRIIAVLGGAVLLCSWLAKRLSDPLARLRQTARKFASGDLNARANASTFPRKPPEYRELASDFDDMAGRIEALVTSQRQLLRDVSHELRTPLTRLSLAVNNARHASPPDVERSLDRIDQESERLNALVDRIMRLSRLEAFDQPPRFETIEFADFLESIVSDADFEATARNRRVSLLCAVPCRLSGDRELLREAIENVVRNAIRYTPEGTTVTVEGHRDASEYRIVVRDRGPGVPPEHLASIFEPFYRAPQRADADSPGFGIGLAITKRAIALHRGSVAAENCADGFEFVIAMPAPLI